MGGARRSLAKISDIRSEPPGMRVALLGAAPAAAQRSHMRQLIVFVSLVMIGCSGGNRAVVAPTTPTPQAPSGPAAPPASDQRTTHDVNRLGVPRFIAHNYIDLGAIEQISRFRSGEGHSYSDQFESCRSMKHYFQTPRDAKASSVRIFAPVDGDVVAMHQEWAGTQIRIRPADQPAFSIILFHVTPTGITVGDHVSAGQAIGHHVGNQTMSDVAVSVDTPEGFALVSWFDAMMDPLLETYRVRGLRDRQQAIISRDQRDANPLSCNGESFLGKGTLDNWVVLR
jgi:hypothetical protein